MTDMLRAQQNNVDVGRLRMNVIGRSEGTPIPDARISLSYSGNPTETIEELKTDQSGNTEEVAVATPPLEYSMEPSERQPFSQFTINVTAEGYRPINISGIEVLPTELSIQNVELVTIDSPGNPVDNIVIPESTLFGNFPPKIPEDEVKPMAETGEIVLNRVVIPEYVVVHDGPPGDNTAANYYVKYRDYIKNVGSSEIYATWSDATIRANILAIMSFTMNRVFTEWYRGQGKNFTITSSTAYDHAFSFGRTIYKTISDVVDSMFENYLSRPNIQQPILTQYCDGERVTCPNWMTQWGSKFLGDQGYSAIEILRYFYGSDMYINTAESIAGIPASWPGYNLTLGATGAKVRQVQEQLARISKSYPAIPTVTPDGIYGPKTQEAVKKFQQVFGLPQTGIIDYNTWYKISAIYVAVTRIAELM